MLNGNRGYGGIRIEDLNKADIIFLSYSESNADENWQELKARFPHAKRVHGVKGIANAHKAAAQASETEFFFVVDGDNKILPEFQFSTKSLSLNTDTIYVWRCRNPVNDLVYGYGAVKLYNKQLLKHRYENRFVDLASTVTEKYHIVNEVASETHFHGTPEEAWRGAFRECAKLASQKIHRQKSDETLERLNAWCERAGYVPNSQWALLGARQGREFGEKVLNSHESLKKINDFGWLHQQFLKIHKANHKQISIVIPTHERQGDVIRLLDSLKLQTMDPSLFEVLVVSNFEDKKLEMEISQRRDPFEVRLESVGLQGVNYARNLGLEKARGDIAFLLDDDCELIDEDHLKKLRSQHHYYQKALAIGGGYEIPESTGYVARIYHYLASFWFDAQSKEGSEALNLLGGNVSYKLSELRRHQLKFDDSIVFGGAESEFHARIKSQGFELRNTSLNVRHHLKMGLKDFYRKAFMQGMGLEKTTRFLDKKAPDSWSPRGTIKHAFMRYHYDRIFNKGRSFARKNPEGVPAENLPYQNESLGLFLQTSLLAVFFLPYGLAVKGFWLTYQMVYVNMVLRSFWMSYKICLVTWGLLKRIGIFMYWRAINVKTVCVLVINFVVWRLHSLGLKTIGLLKMVAIFAFWQLVKVKTFARRLASFVFWQIHSLALKALGLGKRLAIFCYWQGVKVKVASRKMVSALYWKGYHHALKLRGFVERNAIQIYWALYPVRSFIKGRWKKYSIKTYWFMYYMKKQFHKDMIKKIQLWHFGVDTSNLPRSLKLAENPSMYLPVSGECKASCSYCPQLKARWSVEASVPRPEPGHLKAMGYSSVTYPCNFLSLDSSEQSQWMNSYGRMGQELVINPDAVGSSRKSVINEMVASLDNLGRPQALLLFRNGKTFDRLREALSNMDYQYRILFVFDVSGDPKKLYQSVPSKDWGRIQFLNATTQSPEVTDDRNRKLAPRVGRAIKQFQLKDHDFWPETSHVHYPFLVSDDSKASVWVQGGVSWQSPAVETMSETPRYSIVVPVRYQIDHACKVLTNLARQTYNSHDFEILFVDDGNDQELGPSIEESWRQIGEPALNIRVVRYPRETELGYDTNYRAGQARNMGLRFAKGERLLFVDSDILIAPDLFQRLDETLTDNMIIQFPRYMLTEDATRNFENYESIEFEAHTYSQSKYWEEFKTAERWMDLKNYWKYTCTYGLCLTRNTLATIGPFRTDFIFYGFEDVDLGYRLFQRGGQFELLKSPVYHLYPDQNHSFHFDKEKRYQALSRSASIFFQRNMDLNFYFDLRGFLNRPWYIRMRKPFYTARYHARKRLPFVFGQPEA